MLYVTFVIKDDKGERARDHIIVITSISFSFKVQLVHRTWSAEPHSTEITACIFPKIEKLFYLVSSVSTVMSVRVKEVYAAQVSMVTVSMVTVLETYCLITQNSHLMLRDLRNERHLYYASNAEFSVFLSEC